MIKNLIALFCAVSITVSSAPIHTEKITPPKNISAIKAKSYVNINESNANLYAKTRLWRYLRKGLNYLEASGEDVPLNFKHPGGVAYGPLAITPIAVKDVQQHYPSLSGYSFEDVISKRSLYEKFAILYAYLLLKHYIKMEYLKMPREEVFDILQKAWFLGPTLYREGSPVIASRETRAREYIFAKS